MSTPAANPRNKPKWKVPRWLKWLGWSALGLCGAAIVVFYATIQFGAVEGVELNPHSFARRSYSLYEIPLIRLQVRGVRREDLNGDLAEFLAGKGYIVAAKKAPDIWHIISASRGTQEPRLGDADILSRYLDAADGDEKRVWIEWSNKHPEVAKVFWPAAATLAQEELYIHIPPLFDRAQQAEDSQAFQNELDKDSAVLLFEHATRLTEAEEHAEALRVLDKALLLNPDDSQIKRARESARALAKPEDKANSGR